MNITRKERDALWESLASDLLGTGDFALVLSQGDHETARLLHERYVQDVRLLDHLGWQQDDERASFAVPVEDDAGLSDTLRRLGASAAITLATAILDSELASLERLARTCETCARAAQATPSTSSSADA